MLERLRHSTGSFRAVLVSALIALAVLAGIVQARAMSEAGIRAGFTSHLTLCLQNGLDGSLPSSTHECEACRMPVASALPALAPTPGTFLLAAASLMRVTSLRAPVSTYRAIPPSRGPPAVA
jgi:hypothetical protein